MQEKVFEFIIQFLPALIAGLTCIITMFKVLTGINKWEGSINDTNLNQISKDLKNVVKRNMQLMDAYKNVLAENSELKQQLKDVLTAIQTEAERKLEPVEEEKEE